MFVRRNKAYIYIFIICSAICIYKLLSDTNLFWIIREFLTNEEYRNNYTVYSTTLKENATLLRVIADVLTSFTWSFNVMISTGISLFQIITPCVCSVAGIKLYKKYNTIYQLEIHRNSSFKKFIAKRVCIESFKMACAFFFAFLVLFFLSMLISGGAMNAGYERYFLSDILGKSFNMNSPFIYYMIIGIFDMFYIPFIYAFFSCMLAVVLKSEKQVFFVSNLYYYGISCLGFGLRALFGGAGDYLNPSAILDVLAFDNLKTIPVLFASLIPVYISLYIYYRKTKHVEI